MAVRNVVRNSKRTFFSGGKGSLIPFSGNKKPPSQRDSRSNTQSQNPPPTKTFKGAFPASNPPGEIEEVE